MAITLFPISSFPTIEWSIFTASMSFLPTPDSPLPSGCPHPLKLLFSKVAIGQVQPSILSHFRAQCLDLFSMHSHFKNNLSVPQALNILMSSRFNSSSSNPPLNLKFAYQNAYLPSPLGSWMSISMLIRLKPNSWFPPPPTPSKLLLLHCSPSQSLPVQTLSRAWSHPWCFPNVTPHIGKPVNSASAMHLPTPHTSFTPTLPQATVLQ